MKTIDCRIVKIENVEIYVSKYHELSRKMIVEIMDVYDSDVNFVVALYPPFSYNYLEAGDVIRLTYKMKTGRNKKSGYLNNYIYADEVVALQTASQMPWMSPSEVEQTKIEDEEKEKAYIEEQKQEEEKAKTDGTALFNA